MTYCPTRDQCQARPPAELGLAPDSLAAAIDYHLGHETKWRRDFLTGSGRYIGVADKPHVEPFLRLIVESVKD
jgi:hypothetical protein